jgi:hypothetical protein
MSGVVEWGTWLPNYSHVDREAVAVYRQLETTSLVLRPATEYV